MTLALTNKEFIDKCHSKWGEEYDYSECNYTKGRAKVRLRHTRCDMWFDSVAQNHLHLGSGCPCCYGTPKKNREQFIAEAVAFHGEKYDYSEVVYVDMLTPVKVTCRTCDTHFNPIPANHTHGKRSGCPNCANIYKCVTQNEFISRARKIHGEKYDYSDFVYTYSDVKSTIRCRQCDTKFEQTPHHHTASSIQNGCPNCCRGQLTQDEFIRRCVASHGDKYDYSQAVYHGIFGKVKIFCKKCNDFFEQVANTHSHGSNCPRCVQQSYVSIQEKKWLDSLNITDSDRQIKIKGFRSTVDALVGNIVYEFHGSYWHGDPRVYAPDVVNKRQKKTMGFLYQRTLSREARLRSAGYEVRFVWELDWLAGLTFSPHHPA